MIILVGKEVETIDAYTEQKIVYIDSRKVLFLDLELPTKKKKMIDEMLPFALEEIVIGDVSANEFRYAVGKDGRVHIILMDRLEYMDCLEKAREFSPHIDVVYPDIFLLPFEEGKVVVFCFEDRVLVRTGQYKGFVADNSYAFDLLDSIEDVVLEIYTENNKIDIPERYRDKVVKSIKFEDFLKVDIHNKLHFFKIEHIDFKVKFDFSSLKMMGIDKDKIKQKIKKFYKKSKMRVALLLVLLFSSLTYSGEKYLELFLQTRALDERYVELAAQLQVDPSMLESELDRRYYLFKSMQEKEKDSMWQVLMNLLLALKDCMSCRIEKVELNQVKVDITLKYEPEAKSVADYVEGLGALVENVNNLYKITYQKPNTGGGQDGEPK